MAIFENNYPVIDLTAINFDQFLKRLSEIQTQIDDLTAEIGKIINQPVPIATTTQAGIIKASATLNVATDGTASVPVAAADNPGVIRAGDDLRIDNNGDVTVLAAASADSVPWSGITNKPNTYDPPLMSGSIRGGAKVGSGLAVNANQELYAKIATSTAPGIVKPGTGVAVAADGTLTVTGEAVSEVDWSGIKNVPYGSGTEAGVIRLGADFENAEDESGNQITQLADSVHSDIQQGVAIATNSNLGQVMGGGNVEIGTSGQLNYTLPQATNSVIGGIRFSPGVFETVNGNTRVIHSANADTATTADSANSVDWTGVENVPVASTTTLGVVKVDQDESSACYMLNGSLRTRWATPSQSGAVRVGTGLSATNGLLRVAAGNVTGSLSGTTLNLNIST